MIAYQDRASRTIADAVTEAIAAASPARARLLEHICVLIGLHRGAPAVGAAIAGLRDDLDRGLDRLRGVDLDAADELELELLGPAAADPAGWGPEWDTDVWVPVDPADADADPACPTARELATRRASGTIAELSIGCIYVDADGTVFLQPHPTGREEDDLPDRVRVGVMVWYDDEARWVAEPRHEGHDLDMHAWGIVEDVARDWSRQF